MKKFFLVALTFAVVLMLPKAAYAAQASWWQIQSIDTKKYSLDPNNEMEKAPAKYEQEIDDRVAAIAKLGVTHITLDTYYDDDFLPSLAEWVSAAHKYGIHVWFRGNFEGWTGQKGADKIDVDTHKQMLQEFLDTHAYFFEAGDIFTSCANCELGPIGDPRQTHNAESYRAFLVDEYTIAKESFFHMGKNVTANLFPMPMDLARVVLDENTTRGIGGFATIDETATDAATLNQEITAIRTQTKGKVILSSLTAPVSVLPALATDKNLIGMTYTGTNSAGIEKHYIPNVASGTIYGRDSAPLASATIATPLKEVYSDANGSFVLPLLATDTKLSIKLAGYHTQDLDIVPEYSSGMDIRLEKEEYSIFYKIKLFIQRYI